MLLLNKIYKEISQNLMCFSVKKDFNADTLKQISELAIFFDLSSNAAARNNFLIYPEKIKTHLLSEIFLIPESKIFGNYYASYHSIVPYVTIRRFSKHEKYEKCLSIIIENKLFPIETPPHRTMEWDYLIYKIDNTKKVNLPTDSVVFQDFFPQFFNREAAYTLTHALFYLTDFGFETNSLVTFDLENLKFKLECLIVKFYEERDMDLLLELSINYLGLLPYTEIDFDFLCFVKHGLYQTHFIEFDWTKEVVEKKYHTFFVLGIFLSLIDCYSHTKNIDKKQVENLKKTIKQMNFFEFEEDIFIEEIEEKIRTTPLTKSWEILKNMKKKNFELSALLGINCNNNALPKNILNYLIILQQRNQLGILWSKEFAELSLTEDDQKRLSDEYNKKVLGEIEYLSTLIKNR